MGEDEECVVRFLAHVSSSVADKGYSFVYWQSWPKALEKEPELHLRIYI